MKRNESILVYGVTGLLVVILLVAVVFGNDGSANAGSGQQPPQQGKTAANQTKDGLDIRKLVDEPKLGTDGKLNRENQVAAEPTPGSPKGSPGGNEGSAPAGTGALPGAALSTKDNPGDARNSLPLEAAFLLRSTREGDFRRVTVQDGESLSQLMERFGVGQSRRDEVLRLNETLPNLDRIRSGQQIILPWVEDAVLIAAEKQRKEHDAAVMAERNAAKTVPSPSPNQNPKSTQPGPEKPIGKFPLVMGATKERKVKKGESLWKIASECGGNVTTSIEQIRALNPQMDLDPLREGVVLKVPAK